MQTFYHHSYTLFPFPGDESTFKSLRDDIGQRPPQSTYPAITTSKEASISTDVLRYAVGHRLGDVARIEKLSYSKPNSKQCNPAVQTQTLNRPSFPCKKPAANTIIYFKLRATLSRTRASMTKFQKPQKIQDKKRNKTHKTNVALKIIVGEQT